MRALAQARIRYGYRKIRVLLIRQSWHWAKAGISTLPRGRAGLRARPKGRRIVSEHRRQKPKATGPNQVWSLDFVADQFTDGHRFRALTVLDVYTRECLAIEVGQSLKGYTSYGYCNRSAGSGAHPGSLLRQRERVHQSGDGPVGVSQRSEDRLLAAREADGQCLRGKLQRNAAGGMSRCPLVQQPRGSLPPDRGLESGIQCESTSQGPRGEDAARICKTDRG